MAPGKVIVLEQCTSATVYKEADPDNQVLDVTCLPAIGFSIILHSTIEGLGEMDLRNSWVIIQCVKPTLEVVKENDRASHLLQNNSKQMKTSPALKKFWSLQLI